MPICWFSGEKSRTNRLSRGPARDAITRGKAPSFFVMNGHDLLMILSEAMTLPEFLKQRIRLLGEEGRGLRAVRGTEK
jgi:hypothetical protein